MNITIRTRQRAKKRESVYLEIYHRRGKVKYVSVGTIFQNPKNEYERLHNTRIKKQAEDLRLNIYTNKYSYILKDDKWKPSSSFLEYFKEKAEELAKKNSHQTYSCFLHFQNYCSSVDYTFIDLTDELIIDFKSYLSIVKKKDGKGLSKTSINCYFNNFRAVIKKAIKEGLILYDILANVQNTTDYQSKRTYLTPHEVKAFADVNAKDKLVQRAFLFACYTGLRYKDIKSLKRPDFKEVSEGQFELTIIMNKTDDVLSIPIHPKAMKIVESVAKNNFEKPVFHALKYSARLNDAIREIAKEAGICKHIFFYTSRHSFASNLLNEGVELIVIKDLLGHKNLKTTTIYAKMSSERKRQDVMKLI